MHKVVVDNNLCRNYGLCAGIQPDVFFIPPGAPFPVLTRDVIDDADLEDVLGAVRSCPSQAISVVDV